MRKLSSILLFSALCLSCGNNNKSPKTNNELELNSAQESKPSNEKHTKSEDAELLTAGRELWLNGDKGGQMKFLFKEVNTIELPDGTYNLVLLIQFKNELTQNFFISDVNWKLTDCNMIEVKESGVYSFDYNDFKPAIFFFTTVDAGFGKIEEVGYRVNKGTYYLHIADMTVARIEI